MDHFTWKGKLCSVYSFVWGYFILKSCDWSGNDFGIVSGPCWRVFDEVDQRHQTVPHPQWLPLRQRGHHLQLKALPRDSRAMRQEAHHAPRRNGHRPTWAGGRVLQLISQMTNSRHQRASYHQSEDSLNFSCYCHSPFLWNKTKSDDERISP